MKKILLLIALLPALLQGQRTILTRETLTPNQQNTITKNHAPAQTFFEMRNMAQFNDSIIYRFNYNGTIGDFRYDPLDTTTPDDSATVFVSGSKRYKRNFGDYIDARWFGVVADGSTDDHDALQRAMDYITHRTGIPNILQLPIGKTTRVNSPIIAANFDGDQYYQTSIMLRGDPGNTRLNTAPTKIYFNFKNAFGIGFQLCKSGGMIGLALESNWTAPTMDDSTFYTCDVSEYVDPAARNTQYDPQTLIAVDPFKPNGLTGTGGYPGLSAWYDAPLQPVINSGSSGLTFEDMQWISANIGIIFSPNATTQNAEDCIVRNIYAHTISKLIVSTQTEEKNNHFSNIMAWGGIHTVFTNFGYGYQTPGVIVVDNVQTAGRVNTFFNWGIGGYHPSYITHCYSESLGRFGALYGGGGLNVVVRDSYFGLATPSETQGKLPNYHVSGNRDVKFEGCTFRMYGTGLPVVVEGSPIFKDCTFEDVPSVQPGFVYSSPGGPDFQQCNISYSSTLRYLGATGTIYGSNNQFHGMSSMGDYKLAFQPGELQSKFDGYTVQNNRPREYSITASLAITVATNRTFTIPWDHNGLAYVGQPVYKTDLTTAEFAGIVTDTSGDVVTVGYAPRGITSGTYAFALTFKKTLCGFFGNTTSASAVITNCIFDDLTLAVGDYVYAYPMGGWVCVRAISGTNVTVSYPAAASVTGVYFRDEGITREVIGKNIAPSSYLDNNSLFKKGDRILYYSNDSLQVKTCFKSGVFNATGGETRQALFHTN